jgi:hypothetical protein
MGQRPRPPAADPAVTESVTIASCLVASSISYNYLYLSIARRIGAETDRFGQIEAALWPSATNRRMRRSEAGTLEAL